MKFRIPLFTLFVSLAMTAMLFAQPPGGPGRGLGMGPRLTPLERAEQLKDELNLTDEQTSKVKAVFEEQDKEMKKLFEKSEDDRAAMRDTMLKKRKETDQKITSLLNAEQKKKFEELQKQRQKRLEERRRREDS